MVKQLERELQSSMMSKQKGFDDNWAMGSDAKNVQRQTSSDEAWALGSNEKILLDVLRKNKVNTDSCRVMLDNGIDSMEALLSLMPSDFDALGLLDKRGCYKD